MQRVDSLTTHLLLALSLSLHNFPKYGYVTAILLPNRKNKAQTARRSVKITRYQIENSWIFGINRDPE